MWGHICQDSWDNRDAKVTCRNLGLPSACKYYTLPLLLIVICPLYLVPKAFVGSMYGERGGPVLMDNVRCTGDEQSLLDCPHDGVGEFSCSRYDDIVSVVCANGKFTDRVI